MVEYKTLFQPYQSNQSTYNQFIFATENWAKNILKIGDTKSYILNSWL